MKVRSACTLGKREHSADEGSADGRDKKQAKVVEDVAQKSITPEASSGPIAEVLQLIVGVPTELTMEVSAYGRGAPGFPGGEDKAEDEEGGGHECANYRNIGGHGEGYDTGGSCNTGVSQSLVHHCPVCLRHIISSVLHVINLMGTCNQLDNYKCTWRMFEGISLQMGKPVPVWAPE